MAFGNAKVLSFESRRGKEMAELIRINGGDPLIAPALREIPIEQNVEALEFGDRLFAGAFDMMIFLTGVGTRQLEKVLEARGEGESFKEALRSLTVVARGPKPSAVLREWKVPVAVSVPEPNTWREVLNAVAGRAEKRVALQEYGRRSEELLEGLRAQGREVTPVPVYQWDLPADTAPLGEALEELMADRIHVVLFTTGVQVEHFLEFAGRSGAKEQAAQKLRESLLASIGPTCSESLRECGLEPAMEPSHPKMGILVREAAEAFGDRRKASDR